MAACDSPSARPPPGCRVRSRSGIRPVSGARIVCAFLPQRFGACGLGVPADAAGIPPGLSGHLTAILKKLGTAPADARSGSKRHRRSSERRRCDSSKRPAPLRETSGASPEGVCAAPALLSRLSGTVPALLRYGSAIIPRDFRRNSGGTLNASFVTKHNRTEPTEPTACSPATEPLPLPLYDQIVKPCSAARQICAGAATHRRASEGKAAAFRIQRSKSDTGTL